MREILFRGKRAICDGWEISEWVYGSLINLDINSGYVYIMQPYTGASTLSPFNIIRLRSVIVDPETVGQWTGLVDRNGVKIFEGDIVEDKHSLKWTIAFINESFVCLNEDGKIQFTLFEHHEYDYSTKEYLSLDNYFTVIGNKWD